MHDVSNTTADYNVQYTCTIYSTVQVETENSDFDEETAVSSTKPRQSFFNASNEMAAMKKLVTTK